MLHKLAAAILGFLMAASAGAGTARAVTFDLLFQSSGGKCTDGSATCSAEVGDIVLLDVKFTVNVDRTLTTASVGFDLSAMGIANTAVVGQGFASGLAGATTATLNGVANGGPAFAEATADANCIGKLAGCDHRFTSFGFSVSPSAGGGLTYTAGTIAIDLSGASPGTYTIVSYQVALVDAPIDNACNPHFAAVLTVNAIPEPSTGLLIGLGLSGLVIARPRRRTR
jgi:hypothetical protein